MFLKLPFAVSFSVLFITIQYAVFIYILIYMMKFADVVKNSGHCIYSIGLKCF